MSTHRGTQSTEHTEGHRAKLARYSIHSTYIRARTRLHITLYIGFLMFLPICKQMYTKMQNT